ncbi:peptidylprolyl isomerase [Sulfurovum sp.]|uniref:FKBP-type peptidyl-prolyl cis-trans isomerase n=1 Tax=Sulfurovum sp. TaxID=1969726 RepID=UPI002867DA6D|nr:peptidylprolyl isomerase [Sulfurovum sp.]
MNTITKNTLVAISLITKDEAGNLLEENEEVMYLHGSYGQIFQKLEKELEGKKVSEHFNLLLTPREAFGEYDESLVIKEALEDLPDDLALGMEFEDANEKDMWIVESIENGYAMLNANHELAGLPVRVSGEVLELEHLSDEGVKEILNMEYTH